MSTQKVAASKPEPSVRDRLLTAANELFYEEGIHTVGIDRVIERAGVAKASLYSTFGSKDELVRAYLAARSVRRRERLMARLARHDTPRSRLLAVFDDLDELVASPSFRGCAFVNASAEGPRDANKVGVVCETHRGWLRQLLSDLARELGAAEPEQLGRRLALLYDGAMVGASMERQATAVTDARALAAMLVDAATPRGEPATAVHSESVRKRKR